MNPPLKQEKVMDSQVIHDKVMHSSPRQKMEGLLQNMSPLNHLSNFASHLSKVKSPVKLSDYLKLKKGPDFII